MTITNPSGALADSPDAGTALHPDVRTFRASGAIRAGRVVVLDLTGEPFGVLEAVTGSALTAQVGIANADAAADDHVKVTVYGGISRVAAQGSISAGAQVERSGTTAGSVAASSTPDAGEVLGVALTDAAENLVDVFVQRV